MPKILFAVLLSMTCQWAWAQVDKEADQAIEQENAQYQAQMAAFWASLDRRTGAIAIEQAGATLNVPAEFYYLNGEDAEKVLVDLWGNPPGQNVLGMLFPANMTPFEPDSWAVTIEYEEDGYVSDEDAAEIDYAELLQQMQSDAREASKARVEQGYEAIALVGWAAPPYYDKKANKMYWAKELKFGDQDVNTLNYNIRVLGRKGILVLNFIAGMEQKQEIDQNLNTVLAMADFDAGSRYTDFNPDIDTVAAYGLGALVAGKVIAKTGMLAVLFVFLKKFAVMIVIALGALIKSFFGRRKS